tara:strand:- start:7077 stop:7901 length:825 start_codon:yes stop_codon:yes gene_type:complete
MDLSSSINIEVILFLAFISFIVGLLGGFVGLALGTIRLPIMLLMGINPRIAAGTNILVSSLSSFLGSIQHIRNKRVDIRVVLILGIPACIGAFFGGFLSSVAPENLLLMFAGVLVAWQGYEFVELGRKKSGNTMSDIFGSHLENSNGKFTKTRISLESIAGLIIGLLGGSVGLILGSIRLPAIIYILQIDPRKAAGSNLFIGFFIGILGWIGHAYLDQVNYNILFTMSFTGMIGSYIGASFTGKVSLSRFVLILGIILFIVGILLFIKPFMDII